MYLAEIIQEIFRMLNIGNCKNWMEMCAGEGGMWEIPVREKLRTGIRVFDIPEYRDEKYR